MQIACCATNNLFCAEKNACCAKHIIYIASVFVSPAKHNSYAARTIAADAMANDEGTTDKSFATKNKKLFYNTAQYDAMIHRYKATSPSDKANFPITTYFYLRLLATVIQDFYVIIRTRQTSSYTGHTKAALATENIKFLFSDL